MDIQKEREAFNNEFGVDDADTFPAFTGGIESSAALKCNWLGWKKRAEYECRENPEKIEIEGLKTIHKLCRFGADHNMEGCSFTEIVERMFDELELAKAQAVPESNALLSAAMDAVQKLGSGDFVLVPKEPTEAMYIAGTDKRQSGGNTADVYKAMIEAQEPAPLKLGDLVEPIDHRYTLASGCERYPYAYVVNTNPFQLMSEEGDMYWCCTVEAGGYKLIKSNDQLPEAVSLRMIREGLLAPVEAQEQSHD